MIGARLYSLARRADDAWLDRTAQFFEEFVARFSDIPMAWAELGHALWILSGAGDDKACARKARNAYLRSAELGFHDDGLVFDRIGHAASALGDLAQAEEYLRRALEVDPGTFGFCSGDFLLRNGRADEALPILEGPTKHTQPTPAFGFALASATTDSGISEEPSSTSNEPSSLTPTTRRHGSILVGCTGISASQGWQERSGARLPAASRIISCGESSRFVI